ncbi:MAG: maleylacetoacetate isomerase [Alphaproteobacteria bacterium]
MILHGYWRSSAAYRVRIALNLKRISYQQTSYPLRQGAQRSLEFLARNPQGLVPALETDEGTILTQSLAIIEYLEETHPHPTLLPPHPLARARVRGLAMIIACDLHPLNNLRVLNFIGDRYRQDDAGKTQWYQHWVKVELDALENRLSRDAATGKFCHGNTATMADVCLIPQLYNARRWNCDVRSYQTLLRIEEACLLLPAFSAAAPERQPDSE